LSLLVGIVDCLIYVLGLLLVLTNFSDLARLCKLCILARVLAVRVFALHVLLVKLEHLIVGVYVTLSPDAMMLLDETRWIVTDLLEHLDLLLAVLLPVNHIVARCLLLEAFKQSIVLLSYPIQLSLPLVPIQRLAPPIGCTVRAAHVAVAAHLTEPLGN